MSWKFDDDILPLLNSFIEMNWFFILMLSDNYTCSSSWKTFWIIYNIYVILLKFNMLNFFFMNIKRILCCKRKVNLSINRRLHYDKRWANSYILSHLKYKTLGYIYLLTLFKHYITIMIFISCLIKHSLYLSIMTRKSFDFQTTLQQTISMYILSLYIVYILL